MYVLYGASIVIFINHFKIIDNLMRAKKNWVCSAEYNYMFNANIFTRDDF